VDTAHNFSPYFYAFRLLAASDQTATACLARLAFLPQLACVLGFAWRFCFPTKIFFTDFNFNLVIFLNYFNFNFFIFIFI
jgi:hypothetical protein